MKTYSETIKETLTAYYGSENYYFDVLTTGQIILQDRTTGAIQKVPFFVAPGTSIPREKCDKQPNKPTVSFEELYGPED